MSYRRDNIEVQFYDPACNVWRTITRDAKTQEEAEAGAIHLRCNRDF